MSYVTDPPEAPSRLEDLLAGVCRRRPDALALKYGASSLTFAQLDTGVVHAAGALRHLGVRPGDCVAIVLKNKVLFITTLFAAWRLGASAIPLSVHSRELEISRCVFGSRARVAIVEDELSDLVIRLATVSGAGCRVATAAELTGLMDRRHPIPPDGLLDVEQIALHQFSTGTTGHSKHITRTHRQLLRETELVSEGLGLRRDDTVLAAIPLYHAYGFADALLAPLSVGATIVLVEEFRPAEVTSAIAREKVTVFPGVPFMFGLLADATDDRQSDLSSLRLCVSAGAPLEQRTFETFTARYGVPIRQQYGSTELGAVAINRAQDVAACWQTVGPPLNGVEVEVWNEQRGRAPSGQTGEIVVRSPAQASGYVETPGGGSGGRFVDGWFRTGDIGRIASDGGLQILGRTTLFINTATHKVDPGEVEQILLSHPAVAEAVVVPGTGPYGSEIVKAVVVSRGPISGVQLREYCRGRLADFKIPGVIEFKDAIPRNALGKVLRKYLLEAPRDGATSSPAVGLSDAELEARLALILGDVLGAARLSAAAGFYELGGDSLKAIEIAVAIQNALGVEVPQPTFFSNCTLKALTRVVRELLVATADVSHTDSSPTAPSDGSGAAMVPTDDQQRELWEYLHTLSPEHRGCANVGFLLRIRTPFDRDRLLAAFTSIVGRHDALRARFPTRECMIVEATASPQLEVVDAAALPDRKFRELTDDAWNRGFDLQAGPVCRLVALLRDGAEWVLAFVINHVVVDISSVTILLDELIAEYAGRGVAAPPGAAQLQFADYLRWYRTYCDSSSGKTDDRYWRQQLEDPEALVLFRRAVEKRSSTAARFAVESDLIERLRAASMARSGTLFEMLLAAYAGTLHLQTGKTQILVGFPYSVRRARFMRTVGWITRTVYCRIAVSSEVTLRSLLLDVQRRVRDGLAHALTAPTPSLDRGAQYAMFALDSVRTSDEDLSAMALPLFPGSSMSLHGVDIESMEARRKPSSFDELPQFGIRLMALSAPDGALRAVLRSDVKLLDARALKRTVTRYVHLLDGMAEAPDRPIGSF